MSSLGEGETRGIWAVGKKSLLEEVIELDKGGLRDGVLIRIYSRGRRFWIIVFDYLLEGRRSVL